MKKNNLKRFLASLLAVLMLSQVTGVAPGVFADFGESSRSGIATQAARANEKITLNGSDFSIRIPFKEDGSIDYDTLYQNLFDECVDVANSTPKNRSDVTIERKAKLTFHPLEGDITADPIAEGSTYEVKFEYKVNNFKSVKATCNVTFLGREAVPDVANKDISVNASFNEKDLSINYDALRKAIWDQVSVGLPENVKFEDVSFTYKYTFSIDYWPTFEGKLEIGTLDIPVPTLGLGENTVKLTWGGDKEYKSWEQEITVDVVDNRIASVIEVVPGASITYNMSGSVEKDAIVASVIDYTNSTLPADAKFTVKVKKTTLGVDTWKDITENPMDAGENQDIRISFAGNAEYKPCTIEAAITVKKAPVSITLPIISKLYAGEEIKIDDYCTVTPDDPAIDVYLFFVGVNSNKEACVNFQLTDDQMAIINDLSKLQMELFGVAEKDTIKCKLRDGMKLSEFKETIEKLPGIDKIEFVNNILTILNTMDTITDNTVIAIGTPAHAGVYQATALSFETKNYEAGKGTGSLVILKNWKGIKLVKNPLFDASNNEITGKNNTITVSQAEKIAKSVCILSDSEGSLNDSAQSTVHYWFTGVNKIYAKSTMPTAPGKYIVTASVRGGDFFAFPKTFSFTIVADTTSEA